MNNQSMMISEILRWKNEELLSMVKDGYVKELPNFIEYCENFFKKHKITQKKHFKGDLDEEIYPLKMESKHQKAFIIGKNNHYYLFIYEISASSSDISIYPFALDMNADDSDIDPMNKNKSLKYVLKNLRNATKLIEATSFEKTTGGTYNRSYSNPVYEINDHSRLIDTIEFVSDGISRNGHEGFNLKNLYNNFSPLFKQFHRAISSD